MSGFFEDNVSGVLPICGMSPLFLLIAQCYSAVWMLLLSPVDEHLNCSPFLTIMSNVTKNICIQEFVCIHVSVFLEQIPSCRVL